MKLPEGMSPEYSSSYSAGQIERSSDYRMEQLKKYLESLDTTDPDKQIDPNIIKVRINIIPYDVTNIIIA